MIDKLLGAVELDIHVRVDADQLAFVFGLAPFEAHDYFFVDAAVELLDVKGRALG